MALEDDPSRPASEPPVGCPMHSQEPVAPTQSPADDKGLGRAVTGPKPPLLGWRLAVLSFFRDPIAYMSDLQQRFGDVAALTSATNSPVFFVPHDGEPMPTVFVFGPENNRRVLSDDDSFTGGRVRAPAECTWLASGMTQVSDQRHRGMTAERLSKPRMAGYQQVVIDQTAKMLDSWQTMEQIWVDKELEELAAGIASSVFFGQEPDAGHQTFAEVARDMTHILFSPSSMVPINLPGTPYRKLIQCSQQVQKALFDELERKRRRQEPQDDLLATISGIADPDFAMEPEALTFFAYTLFLAGHDVPANAITFSLVLLTQHPEIYRRLRAELDQQLGGRAPTMSDLAALPFLDAVYRESLRVLGPSLLILRQTVTETSIGGCRLPAGCEVVLSPHMTHVDPRIYSQAHRFDPDRWQSFKPTPYEYLPYSQGHHKCLGAVFAEMEVKTILAMICQHSVLEPTPNARLDLGYTITLRPKFRAPFRRLASGEIGARRVPIRGKVTELVDLPG